ncbi:uncharacterized protein LOC131630636 isoform X1 [Vicia villosa]|uniref:uncharacterized protein LOC131630635 isoform X1 n=1 Tax=Vicia villosa TaxID=3911 RepID=UPI00273C14D9|nr:uncharacterized protein LOC131630635 isoform X1 [Vicia villosa]XP_058757382.1 uncharacterized protein LOC131630636 isoform X1 [Vicia villosa]
MMIIERILSKGIAINGWNRYQRVTLNLLRQRSQRTVAIWNSGAVVAISGGGPVRIGGGFRRGSSVFLRLNLGLKGSEFLLVGVNECYYSHPKILYSSPISHFFLL